MTTPKTHTYAPLNPARATQMLEAILAGQSYGEVSRRHGVSRARVHQIVMKLTRRRGSTVRPIPDTVVSAVAEASHSMSEACAWLHISARTMRAALRRDHTLRSALQRWAERAEGAE